MSLGDPFEGLIGSRSSKSYYIDGLDEDDPKLRKHLEKNSPEYGFYEHMFLEDIAHLLPYGRGFDPGYTVRLSSGGDEQHDLIRDALPSQYGTADSLHDGVRDFVEECASSLIFGPVTFEIEYFYAPAEPSKVEALRFWEVLPGSLGLVKKRPVQFVPNGLGTKVTRGGLHYVELEPENLVTLQLAPKYSRLLAAAWRIFGAADRQQFLPTEMLTEPNVGSNEFRFEDHQSSMALLALSGTRELGWDWRSSFDKEMLDPFKVLRHLRFLRFQVVLRDAILNGLDRLIERAGQRAGFATHLEFEGLLSLEEIDAAEQALSDGKRSIADLFRMGP